MNIDSNAIADKITNKKLNILILRIIRTNSVKKS